MTSGQQISSGKEYPKSDVYERAYVLKLFHNQNLISKFLDDTYPNVFLDKGYRLIIYLMKQLYRRKIAVTVDNLAMLCIAPDEQLIAFCKRHSCKLLTYEELHDILYEPGYNTTDALFESAREEILNRAFCRFVEDVVSEMKYLNSYTQQRYQPVMLGKARAIWKVHGLLYGAEHKRDQLEEAQTLVNSTEEYISTSSQVLNSYIGGFTRRFVASIIAKSSHAKSSWVDYNILHSLARGKVRKVVKITPEEDAGTQYRRYIAMIMKISTTAMRMKTVRITDEHVKIVREKLEGRLKIVDDAFKYKDILEIMHTTEGTDMLILDHLQAIDYPGNRSAMENMIGGIPGLVSFQKRTAKEKNMSIINVSQVNDKDIARSDRIIKAPRYYDAYGSSILYQASREFLALWYPFRDWEDQLINPGTPPSINDIQVAIEKSSFTRIGKMMLHFDPEYNLFMDKSMKSLTKLDYVAPVEHTLFED